jgi:hypothetical protein
MTRFGSDRADGFRRTVGSRRRKRRSVVMKIIVVVVVIVAQVMMMMIFVVVSTLRCYLTVVPVDVKRFGLQESSIFKVTVGRIVRCFKKNKIKNLKFPSQI